MKQPWKLLGIFIFVTAGCTPATATIPTPLPTSPSPTVSSTGTFTASPSPTGTITPTMDLQNTETPSATLTLTLPPAIAPTTQRPPRAEQPTDTPVPMYTLIVEIQPSETASLTPTATLTCESETASVVLSAAAENVNVGDAVHVTVTVNNEGCVALGLPQYRVYIQSDGAQSILLPDPPEPIVHYLGVAPGQSDFTEFVLTAAAAGQTTLTATVSYEVHLGYPGPAYWGMTGSDRPLTILVAP